MKLSALVPVVGLLMFLPTFAFGENTKEPIIEKYPISYWTKMVGGRSMNMRMTGVSVLIGYVPPKHHSKVVPLLRPYLKSKRATEVWMAAAILAEYGTVSRPAVDDLIEALGKPQRDSFPFLFMHEAVALALGKALKDAKPSEQVDLAVKALIARFSDSVIRTREASVRACGIIGPAAKACVPHLAKMLKEEVGSYRVAFPFWDGVAWTCGRMGKAASECVPTLLEVMLRTESPEAILALGKIGGTDGNVVEAIVRNMQQVRDGKVKIKKDGNAVPMSLAAGRAFINEGLRTVASFGPASAEAVPFLNQFLQKADIAEKSHTLGALEALGTIGRQAASTAGTVRKLTKSKDTEIRKLAETTLEKIQTND